VPVLENTMRVIPTVAVAIAENNCSRFEPNAYKDTMLHHVHCELTEYFGGVNLNKNSPLT